MVSRTYRRTVSVTSRLARRPPRTPPIPSATSRTLPGGPPNSRVWSSWGRLVWTIRSDLLNSAIRNWSSLVSRTLPGWVSPNRSVATRMDGLPVRGGNRGGGRAAPESGLRGGAVVPAPLAAVGAGVPADPDAVAAAGGRPLRLVPARVLVGPRARLAADGHARPLQFPA